MVAWKDTYLLGVDEIDSQHKELFRHLASIEEQKQEEGSYNILHVLFFMYHYAVDHFSLEERLMDSVAYPDAERHKAEHEGFRVAALAFHDRIKDPETVGEVLAYVENWIVTHIAATDQRLGSFIGKSSRAVA